MEGLALFGAALVLGVLAGAVMGWVAMFKLTALTERLTQLERQIKALTEPPAPVPTPAPTAPPPAASAPSPQPASVPPPPQTSATVPAPLSSRPAVQTRPPQRESKLIANIKANWMVWLGGICVGLAGILLTKHSIEQGLLGPAARVTLGILIALALHGAAEYLRRKTGRANDVFAALAGGASIMLYAALLAGLHLYELFSPGLVFALLILVSLATMLLALRHGPVLAAIGILGAFSVPILVNTGSNNLLGALIYSMIIAVSALLLMRYVFRPWLWFGTIAGALGWWFLGWFKGVELSLALAVYLTVLSYAAIAIHRWDWCLLKHYPLPEAPHFLQVFRDLKNSHEGRLALLFTLAVLLQALSMAGDTADYYWLFTLPLLPLLFFWVARHNPVYSPFPWLTLLAGVAALLLQGLHGESHPVLPLVLLQLGLLYPSLALWLMRTGTFPGLWASLAFLAPVILIAVGYVRVEAFVTDWRWALGTAVLGAFYLHLVFRQKQRVDLGSNSSALIVSLTLAAHLALSLALVMLVREATLTLALAAQVISLTWLHRQFGFRALELGAKAVLALVLVRLSLNPWLLTYPTDVHWSLWTYGGALLCCLAANRIALPGNFKLWLGGASIHLLVLLLIFEVRYWLYDGDIFANTYGFTEAAINTAVWGALGLVYYWRAQLSQQLGKVYRLASAALLLLALANFAGPVVLWQNPLFAEPASAAAPIATTPIFNILLLAYGVPVILFAIAYRLLEQPYRRVAGTLAGLSLLLFCSLEIRHLWHGRLSLADAMRDGELYTYSMVWLALAISGSVWATRFAHANLYKGSMILLILVIGKIFLVDMEGLTGLLRAASFMGLGLSLLGLAYLHQRFKESNVATA